MADEIPQWAFDRVGALCAHIEIQCSAYYAFARYIAEHEEPPVEPFQGALDAAFSATGYASKFWRDRFCETLRAELDKRGLQIAPKEQDNG